MLPGLKLKSHKFVELKWVYGKSDPVNTDNYSVQWKFSIWLICTPEYGG